MTSMRGSAKTIFLVIGNNGKLLRVKNALLFLIRSRKEIAEAFLFFDASLGDSLDPIPSLDDACPKRINFNQTFSRCRP
jgi:hypothetical protein